MRAGGVNAGVGATGFWKEGRCWISDKDGVFKTCQGPEDMLLCFEDQEERYLFGWWFL